MKGNIGRQLLGLALLSDGAKLLGQASTQRVTQSLAAPLYGFRSATFGKDIQWLRYSLVRPCLGRFNAWPVHE
jgi:hypothetical protein